MERIHLHRFLRSGALPRAACRVEEARDVVVCLVGSPVRLTLTRLAEDSLRLDPRRLMEDWYLGQAFPPPTAPCLGGRPIAA